MTIDDASQMVEDGLISTGMIPKLKSCIHALSSGVERAHMINGTTPHALLLELLTDKGIGTMVTGYAELADTASQPLGNFAAKLVDRNLQ